MGAQRSVIKSMLPGKWGTGLQKHVLNLLEVSKKSKLKNAHVLLSTYIFYYNPLKMFDLKYYFH